MKKRLDWVDYGKGISMLLIIIYHVWAYYVKHDSDILNLLRPTRIFVFFFISGYLFNIETFNIKKMLKSILQKLLFPYFIFTTIIWAPKALAHGADMNILDAFKDIIGGYASWFVAALAISKISLSLIIYFTKSLKWIWTSCIILTIIGCLMTQYIDAQIPWFAHYGLISLIYLAFGITYRKYEMVLSKNVPTQTILSIILYFIFTILDYKILHISTHLLSMTYGNVTFEGVSSFLFISILGIWMTINLVKLLPANIQWLSYIGANSLAYYYLNTGVLVILCAICNKIGLEYNGNDIMPLLLFVITIIALTIISKLINRYAPWMLGKFNTSIVKQS